MRSPSAREVVEEVQRVLHSQRFFKAEALRNFLGFIVERTLQGHADELKESVVAMEAFNRGSSFDPRLDAFVRVQAGRLRTALSEYYQTEGANDPVSIEVPKGSYTPLFGFRGNLLPGKPVTRKRHWLPWAISFTTLLVLAAALLWVFRGRFPSSQNGASPIGRDIIVVADFDNTTGDPVFDQTIRQALLIDLDQSPFLNILPDHEVEETRRLMARPHSDQLTLDLAREVCQRAGGTVVLSGSIASMGRLYVIGMTAANCGTGETIIREQARAEGKEQVLQSLDKAAFDLRAKLGESIANLQKYSVPLERVTTSSLKALQSYSEGILTRNRRGDMESVPFFERAIELDPTFAMAYNRLGGIYFDNMQFDLASEMFRKAFALRERVSQRERYYIESRVYHFVDGDLDKALALYLAWESEFPRDCVPFTGAGMIHNATGDYDKSVGDFQNALLRNPDFAYNYTNLAEVLLTLDRRQETRKVINDMQSRKLEEPDQYFTMYALASLEGDTAEMQRQVTGAAGNPSATQILLLFQAQEEAGKGRMTEARRLIQQAVDLALSLHENDPAAIWQAQSALFDAELGDRRQAIAKVDLALATSRCRDVRILAALALARTGEIDRAVEMDAKLKHDFPLDTILFHYWLPSIEASIDLQRKDPSAALAHLQNARQFEMGQPSSFQIVAIGPMYPVLLRGEALLNQGHAAKSITELRNFQQHPGVVQSYPTVVHARLDLARALAANGQADAAQAEYREFLGHWKSADKDLAVLAQVRHESEQLPAR